MFIAPNEALRNLLRRHLFPACGVRRIHIIGCARSGTTMLHYAMIAFQDTLLCEGESGVRYAPSLRRSLALAAQAIHSGKKINYITKRDYGWFEEEALRTTIDYIKREQIGIINVIRDPRDVLVSKHAGATQNSEYYVSPKRWQISVAAGDYIVDSVKNFTPAITVRYEDLVRSPDQAERLLANTFNLQKRPNLVSLARLHDNITAMNTPILDWMEEAMHKFRNFDDRSVSAWSKSNRNIQYIDALLARSDSTSEAIHQFIQRHNYLVFPIPSQRDRRVDSGLCIAGTIR